MKLAMEHGFACVVKAPAALIIPSGHLVLNSAIDSDVSGLRWSVFRGKTENLSVFTLVCVGGMLSRFERPRIYVLLLLFMEGRSAHTLHAQNYR